MPQRDQHSLGIESFWAALKRAHTGTFHKMSRKHLQRYVDEFSGRQRTREDNTFAQIVSAVAAKPGTVPVKPVRELNRRPPPYCVPKKQAL